jgi:putative endonuclease
VRCKDGSFYTGYARDLKQRILYHNTGKGARYTRARLPVKLVWFEKKRTRSSAMKREAQIKTWDRENKKALISGNLTE